MSGAGKTVAIRYLEDLGALCVDNLPPMKQGDILLHGHTHVPKCVEHDTYTYMNPGSVSIPKENSWHGYMTLEDGAFTWKDFDGATHMTYTV